jgi:GntR family transcriptional regulator, arabinose operon transcriptional repressor
MKSRPSKSEQKPHKPLLYMQVAAKVKEEIRSRKLLPHEPVPSEGELAKQFDVSRMTTKLALELLAKQGIVSRLARRGTFVAEQELHGETNGLPIREPEAVSRPHKRRIAMIFPSLFDYTARIVVAAEQEARKLDCHLLIRIAADKEDESVCLQELYDDGVEGVIIYPRGGDLCSEKVLQLNLLKYPLVMIDRIFREVNIDCVYHDHYQGAYQLAEYLIAKGHKEIGYVSMAFDGVTSREDRYKGYLQAMLDHNLPIYSHNILLHCSEPYLDNLNAPNHQLQAYIESNPSLTAVMCADDYLAASCLYTALHMNKSVPGQLSVVGFTDTQLASLVSIPLTTVRQTTDQLAQAAVQLLIKRMDKSREGAITIKIDTTIIERGSVQSMSVI